MKQLLASSNGNLVLALDNQVFVGHVEDEWLVHLDENEQHGRDDQVQAVTISGSAAISSSNDEYHVCVAVARADKSLVVYNIQNNRSWSVLARFNKTPKRVTSLCFAPPSNNNEGSNILIAADLAGDAYAFSIFDAVQQPRLLLGHTASMLSGVAVVKDRSSDIGRILTSDRDEKVRVSSFPDAYVIERYLLGHTAFISSMDVAMEDGVTKCASCSGDGTIRVWDYLSGIELATATVAEQELVPSRIAMSPDGERIAVIYDESDRLEVYDGAGSLTASLALPSKAVGVTMVDNKSLAVLMTTPGILEIYDLSNRVIVPSNQSKFCNSLRAKALTANLLVPSTVLEKDESGDFKVRKSEETRGPAHLMPWMKVERIEIALERNRRHKRRKKERQS